MTLVNGHKPSPDILQRMVLPRLSGIKRQHGYWMAKCPVHDDRQASLSLRVGDEKAVLINCHAGCDSDDILQAIGLKWEDLDDPDYVPRDKPVTVATYCYRDEAGEPLFYTERRVPKDFRQYHVVKGEKVWNLHGVRRVLYQLPEVLVAVKEGFTIYVVEGEKDVHALEQAGEIATCNPMGAGKWHDDYSSFLKGAAIVIIADRDDPGREHAKAVAASLEGVAASVEIRQAVEGKDASDHLTTGHKVSEFVTYNEVDPADEPILERAVYGDVLLDIPEIPPAVWGAGDAVLWAEGEALVICGPDGTGKTTLAGELVRARLGLEKEVLNLAVKPSSKNILYLAMDRPSQSMRSLARTFTVEDKAILKQHLRIWKGPPLRDLARDPALLIRMCELFDADTIFVDSLKDAVMKLSEDDSGAAWNRARQLTIMEGVQMCELHHTRKRGMGSELPARLDDIYGSRWISAGAGSVVLLWGEAGDLEVKFRHLKPVVYPAGPGKMVIDPDTHRVSAQPSQDWVMQVAYRKSQGLSVKHAATLYYGADDPPPSVVIKVRKELERLASQDILCRTEKHEVGAPGRPEVVYKLGIRSGWRL